MSLTEGYNLSNAHQVLRGDRFRYSHKLGYFVDEHNVREAMEQVWDLPQPNSPMFFKDGRLQVDMKRLNPQDYKKYLALKGK